MSFEQIPLMQRILKMDRFASELSVKQNGGDKHRTLAGAILSIFVFSGLSFMTYYMMF